MDRGNSNLSNAKSNVSGVIPGSDALFFSVLNVNR